jgi:hypothetical protein
MEAIDRYIAVMLERGDDVDGVADCDGNTDDPTITEDTPFGRLFNLVDQGIAPTLWYRSSVAFGQCKHQILIEKSRIGRFPLTGKKQYFPLSLKAMTSKFLTSQRRSKIAQEMRGYPMGTSRPGFLVKGDRLQENMVAFVKAFLPDAIRVEDRGRLMEQIAICRDLIEAIHSAQTLGKKTPNHQRPTPKVKVDVLTRLFRTMHIMTPQLPRAAGGEGAAEVGGGGSTAAVAGWSQCRKQPCFDPNL